MHHIFSPQNANIIIMYVKPRKLISFFIKQGLNRFMKFYYDARGCTNKNLHDICEYFPNISFVGITLCDCWVDDVNIGVRNHMIRHLEIVGSMHAYKFVTLPFKGLTYDSLYKFIEFGSSVGLNIKIQNKIHFIELTNLRLLRVSSKSGLYDSLGGIIKCKKITSISLLECEVSKKSINFLMNFLRLKHLELNGIAIGKIKIISSSLRYVVLKSPKFLGPHELTFLECPNLKSIEVASNELTNAFAPMCPNVKIMIMYNCGRFRNVASLIKYRELSHVTFMNCPNIMKTDVISLCSNSKLRTMYVDRFIDVVNIRVGVKVMKYKE